MAEIFNLHNPELPSPEVKILRFAMELAYDYTVVLDPYGNDELKGLFHNGAPTQMYENADLNRSEHSGDFLHNAMSEENPYEEDLGQVQEMMYVHSASQMRCGQAVNIVLSYLNFYAPEFELYRHCSYGGTMNHFTDHVVGVAHHKTSGKWYAFSPANAFNQDYTIPELYGKPFQRIDNLIVADTFEDLISAITEIEGGIWPDDLHAWTRGPSTLYDLTPVLDIALEA